MKNKDTLILAYMHEVDIYFWRCNSAKQNRAHREMDEESENSSHERRMNTRESKGETNMSWSGYQLVHS